MAPPPSTQPSSTRAERFSWCLFDFANSAYPTVIITAVYVIYFKEVVVGRANPGASDRLWGLANSMAEGILLVISPFLGAIADHAARKRLFMAGFTWLSVIATALLAWTGPGTVALSMALVVAATVGFEGSCVFNNAFLPDLVPKQQMERLSGAAWALGYLGGLGCLLLILPIARAHTQWVPLVVAAWFGLFSLPTLLLLRDRKRPAATSGSGSYLLVGFQRLRATITNLRAHQALWRFLVAYFFYNNAVVTIIVFAVAFSRDSLSFTTPENIALIAVMNVVAAPGALVFGWVAEKIGAKRCIVLSLFMWLAVVAGAELAAWPGLFSPQGAKACFWGVAALAALGIGSIQATSRTWVAQLTPPERAGEFFGFMGLAGRASAVLGPLIFGLSSDWFDSQRVALLSVGLFFLIGLALVLPLESPRS